jgi:hypothetical protein
LILLVFQSLELGDVLFSVILDLLLGTHLHETDRVGDLVYRFRRRWLGRVHHAHTRFRVLGVSLRLAASAADEIVFEDLLLALLKSFVDVPEEFDILEIHFGFLGLIG